MPPDPARKFVTFGHSGLLPSLRSKRFRLVSEQRKTEERDPRFWPRETCAICRAVVDSSSSFFAAKPHGNAC